MNSEFFLFFAGTCAKDYYVSLGAERTISSAGKECVYSIRSQKDSKLWLRFDSISVSPGSTVDVTSFRSSGTPGWSRTLDGGIDSTKVLDSPRNGWWFIVDEPANASFNLWFTSYDAGEEILVALHTQGVVVA